MSKKKTPDKNGDNRTLIIVAVIGLLGVVATGIFGLIANLKPTEISIDATQTAEARLTTPSSPVPFSGRIPFTALDDPDALNADLQWDAGDSELSLYALSPNGIRLIAGPHTWPNFPTIYYKQPIEGNFEVQAKVTFPSPTATISAAQMVGLLVTTNKCPLGRRKLQFSK